MRARPFPPISSFSSFNLSYFILHTSSLHLPPCHRGSAFRALPRRAGHSSLMGLPVSTGWANTVAARAGGKRTAHPAASSTAAILTATSSTRATTSWHDKPPCSCSVQDPQQPGSEKEAVFPYPDFGVFTDNTECISVLCASYTYKIRIIPCTVKEKKSPVATKMSQRVMYSYHYDTGPIRTGKKTSCYPSGNPIKLLPRAGLRLSQSKTN